MTTSPVPTILVLTIRDPPIPHADSHARTVARILISHSFLLPHSPGRFFAANELKTMLAYVVYKYDIKLEDAQAGKRPEDMDFMFSTVPNRTASVMLRRRQD